MKRTQINLTEAQHTVLTNIASCLETSLSALIRQAVDAYLLEHQYIVALSANTYYYEKQENVNDME